MLMSTLLIVILIFAALLGGFFAGYIIRHLVTLSKKGSVELEIKQMMIDAKEKAEQLIEKAKQDAEKEKQELTAQIKEKETELKEQERRLLKKEEILDTRQLEMDKKDDELKKIREEIEKDKEKTKNLLEQEIQKLEQISGISKEEAKNILIEDAKLAFEEDLALRIQKLAQENEEKLEEKAKDILVTAIHRIGNSMPAEVLSTTVELPNDDIKGKIIGREGRNIRAFERASGVDLIVDDTPGTITISSFDPVRRQIARVALENLILDGRIQPAKIEEALEKAENEINKIIKKKGEEAAHEVGVFNLDPKLLMILGRMHFRTSYGQNVLAHSVEMAHIAGIIAEEVGADPQVARAGALLHDIGKAVDHEVSGTHVEIGRKILQKFGVDERVIRAMEAHHEEYPYSTLESYIVQVADAISGGRPGARRDTVEQYIKRLQELESIANSYPEVEKSYAISGGREIRIFVKPSEISDLESYSLARDIAKRVEEELKYPGEIKVHIIRETHATEYAR